ncbi:MAG: hypothetical protein AB7E95_09520 [Kiritimatiellales bacterium]
MKKYSLSVLILLILCGCATPGKVQKMIEENNQKLAAEQLKPEFDRIDGMLAESAGRIEDQQKKEAALDSRISTVQKDLSGRVSTVQDELTRQVAELKAAQTRQLAELKTALEKQIADGQASLAEQLDAIRKVMTKDQELTTSRIQSLSLALNKAQGDMGLVQEKVAEVQSLYSLQQDDLKNTRALVETQKESLLAVFRKQQEDLGNLVNELEGLQKEKEEAEELTAPAPVE